ncbi:MAG: YhbY family RNA-binding protein [Opitutae bacterium]|nr:YhbY family RNA-binding protein [Opitutae bacterium]
MTLPVLTGAQKTKLRGLGQTTADGAYLGKEGATPGFVADFNRLLDARELVKLRFTAGQDRHERAALCEQLAAATPCVNLGTVGHTALFWRPGPGGSKLLAGS